MSHGDTFSRHSSPLISKGTQAKRATTRAQRLSDQRPERVIDYIFFVFRKTSKQLS